MERDGEMIGVSGGWRRGGSQWNTRRLVMARRKVNEGGREGWEREEVTGGGGGGRWNGDGRGRVCMGR